MDHALAVREGNGVAYLLENSQEPAERVFFDGGLAALPDVYKNVGELLFKAEKPKLVEELKERKEMMDLRLKTMSKQEERIQSRFTQLQEQLKLSLGQIPPKGG